MLEKSFGYQLDYLKSIIRDNYRCESPESSFADYISLLSNNSLSDICKNSVPSNIDRQKLCQAPVLAALGYRMASDEKELNPDFLAWWKSGFSRLTAKEAFTRDRASFFFRPIELLGISLGAINCPEISSKDLEWLKTVLLEGEDKIDTNDCWAYLLGKLAASYLDVAWTQESQLIPKGMRIEELALVKFFSDSPTIFTQKSQKIAIAEDEVNRVLLERCLFASETEMPQDVARAAIVYCSLKATVTQVMGFCFHQYYEVANNSEAAIEFIDCISDPFYLATQQLESQIEINLSQEKLKNISKKLSVVESNAKTALKVVNNAIEQKTSNLIINHQPISFVGDGNNINMNEYKFNAPVGSVGNQGTQTNVSGVVEGKQVANDYSINIGQNIDDVNHLISSLIKTIQKFPDKEREEAEIELDAINAEIVDPKKQDSQKFLSRRLKRLTVIGTAVLGLAGGTVKLSEDANSFVDNITQLSEKLEIPIEKIKDGL